MTLLIVLIVVVWLAQRMLAVRQAMRFRRQYSTLRRDGRDVAVGAAKRFGRRVYLAVAADQDGIVREAMVFRGVTIFAQGQRDARLEGTHITDLVEERPPAGLDPLTAEAAIQAAGFLSTASAKRTATSARPASQRTARAATSG